jgi:pyruvate,water dikinase
MTDAKKPADNLIWFLQERAKELNCLYEIEEIINQPGADISSVCRGIIDAIPPGWQYTDVTQAKITINGTSYFSPNFRETPWVMSSDIYIHEEKAGRISVYYTQEMPGGDDGPFLKEETKLLQTIADRLGHFIMFKTMRQMFQEYKTAEQEISEHKSEEWRVVLNLLQKTDKNLYLNLSRKMFNLLFWSGIDEAKELQQNADTRNKTAAGDYVQDDNRPGQKALQFFTDSQCEKIFEIAARHLKSEQIIANIQKWMQEEKLGFITRVVNRNLTLAEVTDAIRRYHHIDPEGVELPPINQRGVSISLIRRFLSGQLHYINIAKRYINVGDLYSLVDHILFTAESQGKLGGKSAGLFLAQQVIKKSGEYAETLKNIKVPRTWYISSDVLLSFLDFNGLDDVVEQKYKDINQIRLEYPHIVQTFKNSRFPAEIIKGLSMVLDDLPDKPLIVRSSSLLEDRMGAAFSGKYKSLFLANQGTKQKRLEALTDAIAEVYASTFGPDPIEYRAERGLLDFAEEMGIMIQEVVGLKIGDYYLPPFAGVAFSRNDFRWSPRLKRSDGLLRIVPGLGTRAVDRVSDDYPVLLAPGQPGLRVNVTIDEVVRYAPKKVDVIDLNTNTFETVKVKDLLKNIAEELPGINKIISLYDGHSLKRPQLLNLNPEEDNMVVTFDGLFNDTTFIDQVHSMLKLLEDKLGTPVDIEFAHDGKNLYLLQCRPQSYSADSAPSPIPKDIPADEIIFSANKHISNGRVPDITHIVYVVPQAYADLPDKASMVEIGRAVSKLNKLLPRRQFVLIGPGRWGSRGNIKLGVNVTYSDINNTAMLIEVAMKKGNYLPDLSFGTHFFQDLVEAEIRYLPLYPDDDKAIFKESFFTKAQNILPVVVPEYAHLKDTIKLVDVRQETGGQILRVLLNAEQSEAVGILSERSMAHDESKPAPRITEFRGENYWAWRLKMAEHIASQLDPKRFGVVAIYVFGSSKNATAGPASDIDLLVHFDGTAEQRDALLVWFEGWSLSLDEMNFLRTGYRTGGLLDVHIITNEDIDNKSSYAMKIGAATDPARKLRMKNPT